LKIQPIVVANNVIPAAIVTAPKKAVTPAQKAGAKKASNVTQTKSDAKPRRKATRLVNLDQTTPGNGNNDVLVRPVPKKLSRNRSMSADGAMGTTSLSHSESMTRIISETSAISMTNNPLSPIKQSPRQSLELSASPGQELHQGAISIKDNSSIHNNRALSPPMKFSPSQSHLSDDQAGYGTSPDLDVMVLHDYQGEGSETLSTGGASEQDERPKSKRPTRRVLRLAELEESVADFTSTRANFNNPAPHKTTISPPHSPSVTPDVRVGRRSSRGHLGDEFRQRIEAMRNEAGSTWLRVYNEMQYRDRNGGGQGAGRRHDRSHSLSTIDDGESDSEALESPPHNRPMFTLDAIRAQSQKRSLSSQRSVSGDARPDNKSEGSSTAKPKSVMSPLKEEPVPDEASLADIKKRVSRMIGMIAIRHNRRELY
jgi:hypothetical protein